MNLAGIGIQAAGVAINEIKEIADQVSAKASSEKENLAQLDAAEQFESIFFSMLIKEMRQTLQEGLFGGESSDSFGALFDQHMGSHLASGAGLGVRDLVLSQALKSQSADELKS